MENQKRILIVEDSPTVVEHMKMLLKNSNVKVLNAGSEFGMMQSIESYGKVVDLILMDLTLKAENGMDLIRNLRDNDRYKDLPIIIITEHANKDLILEARKLKVKGYLKKPIEKETFLDRIYDVIGNVAMVPRKTNTGETDPPQAKEPAPSPPEEPSEPNETDTADTTEEASDEAPVTTE